MSKLELKQALKIMTIEQAIELNNRRFFCNADETVNTIAEWAMRKQIPKKPKIEHRGTIPYSVSCPECGAFLGYDFRNVLYCEMCGQALNWGDGEKCEEIRSAQSVDIEPVVRCRDCKHWGDHDDVEVPGETDSVKACGWAIWMIGANGYCSYGEKDMDGEEGTE